MWQAVIKHEMDSVEHSSLQDLEETQNYNYTPREFCIINQ